MANFFIQIVLYYVLVLSFVVGIIALDGKEDMGNLRYLLAPLILIYPLGFYLSFLISVDMIYILLMKSGNFGHLNTFKILFNMFFFLLSVPYIFKKTKKEKKPKIWILLLLNLVGLFLLIPLIDLCNTTGLLKFHEYHFLISFGIALVIVGFFYLWIDKNIRAQNVRTNYFILSLVLLLIVIITDRFYLFSWLEGNLLQKIFFWLIVFFLVMLLLAFKNLLAILGIFGLATIIFLPNPALQLLNTFQDFITDILWAAMVYFFLRFLCEKYPQWLSFFLGVSYVFFVWKMQKHHLHGLAGIQEFNSGAWMLRKGLSVSDLGAYFLGVIIAFLLDYKKIRDRFLLYFIERKLKL